MFHTQPLKKNALYFISAVITGKVSFERSGLAKHRRKTELEKKSVSQDELWGQISVAKLLPLQLAQGLLATNYPVSVAVH